jgi:hypothetical protein
MQIHLTTVVGSFIEVLPHMLAHYRELGLSSFLVNIHLSDPKDPILEVAEQVTVKFGCGIASVTVGEWQREQVGIYERSRQRYPNDWYILADQDELQVYPHDLLDIIKECDSKGYDYIRGCFVDRIDASGMFPDVECNRAIWQQFPLGGFISLPMLGADPRKVVAAKGYVTLNAGQHVASNGHGCPIEEYFIQVHHFKWVKNLVDRLAQRAEMLKRSNFSHWIESQRFVSYYEKHCGRIDINDPRFRIAECDRDYKHWDELTRMATFFRNTGIVPPRLGL